MKKTKKCHSPKPFSTDKEVLKQAKKSLDLMTTKAYLKKINSYPSECPKTSLIDKGSSKGQGECKSINSLNESKGSSPSSFEKELNRDDKDLFQLSKTIFTEKEFMKIANERDYIKKSALIHSLEDYQNNERLCRNTHIEKQKVLDFLSENIDWLINSVKIANKDLPNELKKINEWIFYMREFKRKLKKELKL